MESRSVIDTLNNHVSIRKYTGEPVSDELIERIILASKRSPTSSNCQAFSFIVIRDQEKKKKLKELVGNQAHVETSDVFIAICADISRLEIASKMHGSVFTPNFETSLVAIVDAAIAGTSLSLAAESVGLGTVMVGGIRNKPLEVAELLRLPKGVFALFGMSIGWPAVIPPQKPRFNLEVNVFQEEYGTITPEYLRNYDEKLANHYRSEGRDTPDEAWTGVMSKKFSDRRRAELKKELEERGFVLE